LGEIDAAHEIIAEMQSTLSQKAYIQFSPSLQSLLMCDASMASELQPDEESFSLIAPAISAIASWMHRSDHTHQPQSPIQRKIVQYWNEDKPPADLSTIMETWRQSRSCEYTLFSRTTAKQFLNERLGASWGWAFMLASSPAEESDFFRLCFLMLEGGIYADSDDWLICDIDDLFAQAEGLTVTLEPFGKVGNNIIIAPKHHPAIVWAAVSAKTSLLQRQNDSTWSKAGPGLLTRAVARHIQRCDENNTCPDLTIINRYKIGSFVQYHTPLPYKKTKSYWNTQNMAGSLTGLSARIGQAAE
jgi:mannosyltransferase OCH1-like enzyme